jgi:hypothetical protein
LTNGSSSGLGSRLNSRRPTAATRVPARRSASRTETSRHPSSVRRSSGSDQQFSNPKREGQKLARCSDMPTDIGRPIPGFHAGGSLAGKDSARASSTAGSLQCSRRITSRSSVGRSRDDEASGRLIDEPDGSVVLFVRSINFPLEVSRSRLTLPDQSPLHAHTALLACSPSERVI